MATRRLHTDYDTVACGICGRTLLRGEHSTSFRDGGTHHQVCELCTGRALGEGWLREGASPLQAAQTRDAGARSLVGRLRARLDDGQRGGERERVTPGIEAAAAERHTVHAVPTDRGNQQARALEFFNASEHPATIAGVIRSLGTPYVHIGPSGVELVYQITVAWELCWYRFEADLEGDLVRRAGQGYELAELGGELPPANAAAADDGTLTLAL